MWRHCFQVVHATLESPCRHLMSDAGQKDQGWEEKRFGEAWLAQQRRGKEGKVTASSRTWLMARNWELEGSRVPEEEGK